MGQQGARHARESGGRFYFHGDTIYSYGSHFPIARHVAHKGKAAVLFTTRCYSVTTAGHKCMVESACRHLTVFHVADLYGDHRKEVTEYRKRFVGLVGTLAKRGNGSPKFLPNCGGWLAKLTSTPNSSDSGALCPCPPIYRAWLPSVKQSRRGRRRGNSGKRRRGRGSARRKRGQENIALWADGKRDVLPGLAYDLPIRLRIAADELFLLPPFLYFPLIP